MALSVHGHLSPTVGMASDRGAKFKPVVGS